MEREKDNPKFKFLFDNRVCDAMHEKNRSN